MKPYEELFDSSITPEHEKWTKDTLAGLPTCKGVLLFTDASARPIQLLQAANCRRTAQAKLLRDEADATPRKKADVSELTSAIYFSCCHNNFLSQLTYTQLAHAVFDKDADAWIQLPKIVCAAIDLDDFLPYFYVTDSTASRRGQKRFGLFPTRKAANEFCDILNTVFTLCRNPALLQTGRETSCPYLQMQTCPGPCLYENLREGYAAAVNQAIKTAADNIEITQQEFQQQMQQASKQMEFEQAQRCKKKLDLLNKLTRRDFQQVHSLEDLCFLHIDNGPKVSIEGKKRKIQQLMWFKITTEKISHLGNCTPENEDDIKQFIESNWTAEQNSLPPKSTAEHLAILSLHLFRSNRPGIWIDCTHGLWLEQIISELNRCFNLKVNVGA